MIEQICNSDEVDLCQQILASTAIVYRPITLRELTSLVGMLEDTSDDLDLLGEIIGLWFISYCPRRGYLLRASVCKGLSIRKCSLSNFSLWTSDGPL
jgi:hypothetical protein